MNKLLKEPVNAGRPYKVRFEVIASQFLCERIADILGTNDCSKVNELIYSYAPEGDVTYKEHSKGRAFQTKTLSKYQRKISAYLEDQESGYSDVISLNLFAYYFSGPCNILNIFRATDIIDAMQLISAELEQMMLRFELTCSEIYFARYDNSPEAWIKGLSIRLYEYREYFSEEPHFSAFIMAVAVVEHNLLGNLESFKRLQPTLASQIYKKYKIKSETWPIRGIRMIDANINMPTPSPTPVAAQGAMNSFVATEDVKPASNDPFFNAANSEFACKSSEVTGSKVEFVLEPSSSFYFSWSFDSNSKVA